MIEISEFDRILCDDILISVAIIKRVILYFDAILSSKNIYVHFLLCNRGFNFNFTFAPDSQLKTTTVGTTII